MFDQIGFNLLTFYAAIVSVALFYCLHYNITAVRVLKQRVGADWKKWRGQRS